MKNEVIPLDRLVINAGTSAGEEDVRAHVCVCLKQINYFPGGLLFEYVIFQHILLEGSDLFLLRAYIRCSILSN